MAKSNKFLGKNPPHPAVAIPAWGMLALTLAFQFIPKFRSVALILYAVDWLALGAAATLMKRKQSIATQGLLAVPIVCSAGWLDAWSDAGEMLPAANIWLVAAVFVLLTLPPLLMAEKKVPKSRAKKEKYWLRAAGLAGLVLIGGFGWAAATNVAFDHSAGSPRTAYVTEKWIHRSRHGHTYNVRVAERGQEGTYSYWADEYVYEHLSEGDAVAVVKYDGFWGAPYYRLKLPKTQEED